MGGSVRIPLIKTTLAPALTIRGQYLLSWRGIVLIYELGGGTFDVSILTIVEGILEVKQPPVTLT